MTQQQDQPSLLAHNSTRPMEMHAPKHMEEASANGLGVAIIVDVYQPPEQADCSRFIEMYSMVTLPMALYRDQSNPTNVMPHMSCVLY